MNDIGQMAQPVLRSTVYIYELVRTAQKTDRHISYQENIMEKLYEA